MTNHRSWLISPLFSFLCLLASAEGCKKAAPVQPGVGPSVDQGPVAVRSVTVLTRTRPATLMLTGTLVGDRQSQLTPLVAGRVEAVLVERGDVVQAGQALIRLRDVDYRSSADNARAALDQARARLGEAGTARDPNALPEVRAAQANADVAADVLRRTQQLASNGSVSDQELQRARASSAAAAAQLAASLNGARGAMAALRGAQVAVTQTGRTVGDSIVRAPFDGEIAERPVNVGEFVTTQRSVITLVRTNPLRMEVQVPQEKLGLLHRGQAVRVRVDAFENREFLGQIQYISAAVRADTRSLIAEAVIPNLDGTLRPGLFAQARVELDQQETVYEVPAEAILSEAGIHRVFVLTADHHVQERVIVIASRLGQTVFIERGVQPNDRLALGRLDRLSDGSAVTE